jgi:adenylate cyclase
MRPWWGNFLRGVIIAVCVGIACCIAFQFNLLYDIQLRSADFLFRVPRVNQGTNPQDKIVIVAIDDNSLNELGHFPSWPRSYHADLIEILTEANARTIVFDVLFAESAPGDEQLASSIKAAGNVVLPLAGTSIDGKFAGRGNTIEYKSFLRPLQTIEQGASALGHANVLPDADGVVRRLPLVIRSGEDSELALALAAVAEYHHHPQIIENTVQDKLLVFGDQLIPVDDFNCMLINYASSSAETDDPVNFQTVSYADVLRNKINTAIFRDSLVIVGATAIGLGDIYWTPALRMMSGVEIHANAMRTILTGNFLKPAPPIITIVSILIAALLCGLIVLRFRLLWATVATLSLCMLYFLFISACFDGGLMLNAVYPPLAILGTFVGINLHSVVSERSQRNMIAKTFGRYVSESVADKILAALQQGELKLGGKEQQVTVLFADIRGFTSVAENMQSEELVRVLNIYLSIVIRAVMKHQGVINKFGGDSVMAIWNAPTACEEHPLLAVKAAMEAQRAIGELQDREPLLPKMNFGIGINTGNAIAGNMGSEDRVEYSVIGSAVNLAARLTSATKSSKVWIGDTTFRLVKDCITAKSLGEIEVKGRQKKVKAYEVVDIYPESIVSNQQLSPVTSVR